MSTAKKPKASKRPSVPGVKAPFVRMRFRKSDPAHNLRAAIQHWVHANGGTAAVVGGIEVQNWNEGLGNFRVAVRCLGKFPHSAGEGKSP